MNFTQHTFAFACSNRKFGITSLDLNTDRTKDKEQRSTFTLLPVLWIPGLFCTDPDPALFVRGFEDANKKYVFCLLIFKGTFTPVL